MPNIIQIIQIDIDQYIDMLVSEGETGNNIMITLYDNRVNDIDSLDKAESAYGEYLHRKAFKGV